MEPATENIENVRKWFFEQYWKREHSLVDISKIINFSPQKVLNIMKFVGVPSRKPGKHTNTTKNKLSNMRVGDKNPMFGRKRPKHAKLMKEKMTGRVFSKDTIQKMSKAKIGICGKDHNKWVEPNKRKGTLNKNIRRLPQMKHWREVIFERDQYTCQICNKKGIKLQADHIKALCILIEEFYIENLSDAIEEQRLWDIDNGRTLCIDCHKATNTFGPKIRNTDEYKKSRRKPNKKE